jgi:hypothetical protein
MPGASSGHRRQPPGDPLRVGHPSDLPDDIEHPVRSCMVLSPSQIGTLHTYENRRRSFVTCAEHIVEHMRRLRTAERADRDSYAALELV